MNKLLLLFLFFLLPSIVYAATFNASRGEMRAIFDNDSGSVTLTWSGIGDIAFVEQY